jgi:hypothetical protein
MSNHNFFKIHKLDQKTLSWWKNRRDKIDFEPSYQRKGRRWSTSDKQYLIDSILNGFDVPKFYMADFVFGPSKLNENKKFYAVIDGKQRLEAIFDFFDDKLSISSSFELLSNKNLNLQGKKYSELKINFPEIAEDFDNFSPDVIGVISDNIEYIEELFVRLNRGKPLSGAELRNAISSPISEIIRKIGSHNFFTSNIRFNTNKGQNLNSAAKIIMFEVSGIQETKKSNLDKFVNQYTKNDRLIDSAIPKIFETLDLMNETFQFKDHLLNSEGSLPVYYWLTRNSSTDAIPYIRDFLEYFQALTKSSTPPVSKNLPITNTQWSQYKIASRSINDKSSHESRYEILKTCFNKWIKKNQ